MSKEQDAANLRQAKEALMCLQLMYDGKQPHPGPSNMSRERLKVKSSHIFRRLADQLSDES